MTEMDKSTSVTDTSWRQRLQKLGIDSWLLLIVFAMVVYGLVMVYSSSWDVSWHLYHDSSVIFHRQLRNLAIGLIGLMIAAFLPLRFLKEKALPIIILAILALLVLLLIPGESGPKRAFLGGSIQPSEMAKLALIMYLAKWMDSKGERIRQWGYGFLPLIGIITIVAALILKQPDLSAAITVCAVAFAMFYIAGAHFSQTLAIVLGSASMGFLLVRISNTGRQRWDEYLGGLVDIERASYHVQRSLQAFFSGGIFGCGLGAGREKFGILPAPHTDSIFAVIGEELGLVGAVLVVVLFALFVWRGFRVALNANDGFAMLLASGITFWIGIEALINMSVLLGMIPFAGNPLPLFSYGGSSLLVTLIAIGFLFNVSRQKLQGAGLKTNVATYGLGRRDRRRRISRLGHSRQN